jgi:hypothetical protein
MSSFIRPASIFRHIEDVVDDFKQIVAAGEDILTVFVIFLGAQRAEHSTSHDL